ncbi:hypothetical protein CR156_08750 [Stenotrophomonas lactitubi]|uniref:hypothetical protein n=1 Tax=Stenotrophomonas TaxID=40323 RepID=UPI000C27334E|nr:MULTISPECIES: hypothetical protein [Stenotrophomonas]MBD3682112.1 hypothetical protein [Stenotrophomonas sp. Br8]PJO52265.1 hypothetical protein CR156_08750 [Stenotrophomonas lactitubi]
MAKFSSQISVSTTVQAVETNFTPQLLIPCEAPYRDESRHHFPCINAIKARRAIADVRLVEEFEKAISTAQNVWIIDKHLFSADGPKPDHRRRIKKVVDWFYTDNIQNVKILTGYHDSRKEIEKDFEDLRQLVTEDRAKLAPPITIALSFALRDADCIHDRFAIVDDELWHFGATVGGFHRDVNAVSRGWNAQTHGAVQFFDTAWKMASDNGKR